MLSLYAEDLRYLPLTDRKHRLRGMVPQLGERLLYGDHVASTGRELFDLVRKRDLEGIGCQAEIRPVSARLKIRNREYSQWAGREELFEQERSSEPDWKNWSTCALVCEQMFEADAS